MVDDGELLSPTLQAKDRSYHSLSSQSGSVKAEEGTEGGGGRGEGGVPQTGHAVLTEGSTDCLTLSRQGLYTAGEVRMLMRFTYHLSYDATSL